MALLALAGAGACVDRQDPGVRVEIHAPIDPGARPDWLWIYWLPPGGALVQGRLPERGMLPATGRRLGSIFVETEGPRDEARLLVVRGQRGGEVVCGGMLRIDPAPELPASEMLQLGPPLPDRDGDGLPDLLEAACATGAQCPAGDAGLPAADGGSADVGAAEGRPSPADGPRDPHDLAPPTDTATAPADRAPDRASSQPDLSPERPLPDLRVGLVAHWRFDDGAGSALARDSSGHNNLGMLLGSAIASGWIAAGRVGGALEVPEADGHGALVLPTDSVSAVSRAFTIAAWTRRDGNRGRNRLSTVLSRRAANSLDADYFALAFTDTGRLRGSVNTHLRAPVVTSAEAVPLQRWVHVAFTYDGSALRLFVDGAPAGMASYDQAVGNAGTPLCLGCAHNRPGHTDVDQSLGGGLDELLLYARALPSDEIARLAAGEIPAAR